MATLQQTFGSGSKFENELFSVITKYTRDVYRNIRIETLLTQKGTTEIDILFCFHDTVFIVEAKNVKALLGEYDGLSWAFVGSQGTSTTQKEYSALNVITQNNIHVRAFKDCYYSLYAEWPAVLPLIVVPNNCRVSPSIANSIYTISQLDSFLAEASLWQMAQTIHRKVAGMIAGDNVTVERWDFGFDPKVDRRVKLTGR